MNEVGIVTDLIDRIKFGIESLERMLSEEYDTSAPFQYQKVDRLRGKIEGMKLALSYAREAEWVAYHNG